jgi:hypothetical protein
VTPGSLVDFLDGFGVAEFCAEFSAFASVPEDEDDDEVVDDACWAFESEFDDISLKLWAEKLNTPSDLSGGVCRNGAFCAIPMGKTEEEKRMEKNCIFLN